MLNESTKRRCIGLALAAVACALLPAVGWAQSIKLSEGMPFSDVELFEISPDGQHVVYVHDAEIDEAGELWSVPMTGGTPVRISGLLPSGVRVDRWLITPDGSRVVYAARQDSLFRLELYQVPIAGGVAPIKLNGPGEEIYIDFLISPGGDRVVYTTRSNEELYSVPIAGGSAVKLNPTPVAGGNVRGIRVGQDRVIYLADQDTDDMFELYSVPIAGGAVVKLNAGMVAEGDAGLGSITPDGSRVIYGADQEVDEVYNLYSVPITGGTPVQLNGGLVARGDVTSFRISPDGSRVVYRADQQIDELFSLYSVAVGGGIVVKLSGSQTVWRPLYSVTPDSSRVVYLAGPADFEDLYSVPILGGAAPIQLNFTTPGGVSFFQISPDGNWVVYLQHNGVGLKTSPAGPPQNALLAWGTQLRASFRDFAINPASTAVVIADNLNGEADPVRRLWQAPLNMFAVFVPSELTPKADFVTGGNVQQDLLGSTLPRFAIGPLGSIVYIADQDTDEVFELYAIPGAPAGEVFSDGFE